MKKKEKEIGKINEESYIENCVGYMTYILQFSICITAIKCNLNHAVIHSGISKDSYFDNLMYKKDSRASRELSCVAKAKDAEQSSENNDFDNLMYEGERSSIEGKENIEREVSNHRDNKKEKGPSEAEPNRLSINYDNYSKDKYINVFYEDKDNLSSVNFIMMPEENENNSFILLINPEFENLILHNMDSSFSSEIIAKGLVVIRVLDNFSNFTFQNFSQSRILFAGFVNTSFARRFNLSDVSHFESSNISETELNLIEGSFKAFFNNSKCSGLGGNSSTGCQSISSQNSQSSSVTSLVSMNLSNMSFFINLITALANDSESNFMELFDLSNVSAIKIDNNNDYLSFSVDNASSESLNSENSINAAYAVDNYNFDNIMYNGKRVIKREIRETEEPQSTESAILNLEINDNKNTLSNSSASYDNDNIDNLMYEGERVIKRGLRENREIINEKDKKENGVNITPTVRKLFTDYNYYSNNIYINVSVDNDSAEDATVTLTVRDWTHNPALHREPGSTPGCGEPPTYSFEEDDSKNKASSFRKCYIKKWKYFYELNGNEKVLTLNSTSGEIEWQLPSSYQEFDNSKLNGEMYKIELVDGDELVVSEKHRVYVSDHSLGKTLYPVNERINNLPLNSENLMFLNNLLREYCNKSIKGGFISKNIIPNDSPGGNLSLFKKSLSRVNMTLCSYLALSNIFGSLDFNLTRTMSNPLLNKELIRPAGIFSSAINEISLCDNSFIFNSFGSQFEGCKNTFPVDFRIILLNNLFNCNPGTEKPYDIFDKYSGVFECQVSTTNFIICNNIFVDFSSHEINNNDNLYKFFYNNELASISSIKITEAQQSTEAITNNFEDNDNLMYDEKKVVSINGRESKSEEIELNNSTKSTEVQKTTEDSQTTETITYLLGDNENQKNLQKVPDSTLKSEVCSELFFHSRFLCSSKRLHSSPFSKMESSGFDDKYILIET